LQVLNLHNGLGPEGAKALAEALKVNNTLQKLDLRGNNIGAGGAKAIAECGYRKTRIIYKLHLAIMGSRGQSKNRRE